MKIKTTKLIAICMVAMMGLFAIGCDSGSSNETEGPDYGVPNPNIPGGSSGQFGLTETTVTITVGQTKKLTVTQDGSTVKWSSDNNEVATVSNDGTVTAVKIGEANITAESNGKKATCKVIVCATQSSGGDELWDIDDGYLSRYYGSETNVTIPDSVTVIGKDAFYGRSLVSITIPASVTSIECTFSNLTEITFKGTMDQWKAIQGSDKVETPGIRCNDGYIGIEGVPEYLIVKGTKLTGYNAYNLGNIVIPEGVTSIEDGVFDGCTTLTGVTIPKTVTSIGKQAFSGCTKLASVTITDGGGYKYRR
ncbi:MAG: leucine-rich repeat protein [Treponema sp.]|nr:leucine-rich repeat protein [Treponema sp.]